MIADLKPIYKAATEESASLELNRFEKPEEKHSLIVKSRRQNGDGLFTFFMYPPKLRKLIYMKNMIERYHKQLRKVTRGEKPFSHDESLLKMLYLANHGRRTKWTGRVQNWGQMLLQLTVFYPDRVKSTLKRLEVEEASLVG